MLLRPVLLRAGPILSPMPSLEISAVPLPVASRKLNPQAGLRVFHLVGARCLVGWVEGQQSYRAGVLDVADGSLQATAPLVGDLTGHLADEQLLWLLTNYGLQEVDRESFSVRRTLRAGLPKYATRLLRIDHDHALVVVKYGQSHALVNLRTMSIARRIRIPEPDIALPTDDGAMLLSFRYGVRRRLTADLRAIAGGDAIPRGTGASLDRDRAVFVTAVPKPSAAVVRDVGLDPHRYVDLEATGTVGWLGPCGPAVLAAGSAEIGWIHGQTANGDIVASDGNRAGGIGRLVILRPDGQTQRAFHEFPLSAGMVAVLSDSAAVASPRYFGDARSNFELLRW